MYSVFQLLQFGAYLWPEFPRKPKEPTGADFGEVLRGIAGYKLESNDFFSSSASNTNRFPTNIAFINVNHLSSMAGFKLQIPQHRELTGGDLLAQSLRELGIKVAFGLHGGHLDAFLMGCEDVGIRLIDTRHETVAVQAAEGYSKVTGEVGTCFVTANSGFVFNGPLYLLSSGLILSPDSQTEFPVLQQHLLTEVLSFVSRVRLH